MKPRSNMSKVVESKSVESKEALGVVTDPVPHVDPPAPPEGFVAPRIGRGPRPQRVQVELANKCADELRASSEYVQQFGDSAPAAGDVADALSVARAWSDKLQKAAAWHAYVQYQEHLAWKNALALSGELQVVFAYRQSREAKLTKQYPSLARFFGASKERAKRALATRKSNQKQKQKEPAAASPAPNASPPTTGLAPVDAVKAAAVKLLN